MSEKAADRPIVGALWMGLSGLCFIGVYVGVYDCRKIADAMSGDPRLGADEAQFLLVGHKQANGMLGSTRDAFRGLDHRDDGGGVVPDNLDDGSFAGAFGRCGATGSYAAPWSPPPSWCWH